MKDLGPFGRKGNLEQSLRIFLASAALFSAVSLSHADETIPFVELDFNTYCTELVSKMLDADEKKQELMKCLVEQTELREKIRDYWNYVSPERVKFVLERHYKDPKFHTYHTLLDYVVQDIGYACMVTKKLICRAP